VSGLGNLHSSTDLDLESERKVVFHLQFINPIAPDSKAMVVKNEVEVVK
jgi:hypothetical protein